MFLLSNKKKLLVGKTENRNLAKYFDQFLNPDNNIWGSENYEYPLPSYSTICYDMLIPDN